MDPTDELRHVLHGADRETVPSGAGLVTLTVDAPDASAVLGRAAEVMTTLLRSQDPSWLPLEGWRARLPAWFVQGCAPELSPDERQRQLDQLRDLSPAARAEAGRQLPWSLDGWLYWLEPDERQWYWWSGVVEDEHRCTIQVEVEGWPVALGALVWLLRVAGADSVEDDLP